MIQLYSNEKFSVRTIQDADGTVWFVAKDIMHALEYSDSSTPAQVMQSVPECWKGIKRIDSTSGKPTARLFQDVLCLTEQGVYFFLGRSDKPKALPYQMWIAGDVVPSIHATGSYSVRSDNHTLDIQLKTIDVECAKILQHMLDAPAAPLSEESRAVIQHEVFKIITGEQCLSMLPAIADKYYSATEIGEMFGVSSKKIGKVAKANGLKSDEGEPAQFGQWRLTKSPYSDHQCRVFVYNSSALEWFKAHSDLLK